MYIYVPPEFGSPPPVRVGSCIYEVILWSCHYSPRAWIHPPTPGGVRRAPKFSENKFRAGKLASVRIGQGFMQGDHVLATKSLCWSKMSNFCESFMSARVESRLKKLVKSKAFLHGAHEEVCHVQSACAWRHEEVCHVQSYKGSSGL